MRILYNHLTRKVKKTCISTVFLTATQSALSIPAASGRAPQVTATSAVPWATTGSPAWTNSIALTPRRASRSASLCSCWASTFCWRNIFSAFTCQRLVRILWRKLPLLWLFIVLVLLWCFASVLNSETWQGGDCSSQHHSDTVELPELLEQPLLLLPSHLPDCTAQGWLWELWQPLQQLSSKCHLQTINISRGRNEYNDTPYVLIDMIQCMKGTCINALGFFFVCFFNFRLWHSTLQTLFSSKWSKGLRLCASEQKMLSLSHNGASGAIKGWCHSVL